MSVIDHRLDDTRLPARLEEIEDAIYSTIDRMVLEVGAQLQQAWEQYPTLYEQWVETRLPFGLDKARRLRRIHQAFQHFDDATLARFPRPWQALYAISRMPADRVETAVASGEIHPDLTVRETQDAVRRMSGRETKRFSEPDLIAGKLMGHRPEALSSDVREQLVAWIR